MTYELARMAREIEAMRRHGLELASQLALAEAEVEQMRETIASIAIVVDAEPEATRQQIVDTVSRICDERERLAAVLDETPENIEAVARAFAEVAANRDYSRCRDDARRFLAALRARAGLETPPPLPCGHSNRAVCSAAMCDGKPL